MPPPPSCHGRAPALLVVALCTLAASACLPLRVPTGLPREPDALLAQVRAEQHVVQRVQGEARARLASPQGSGSAREFIAAERPDRLHVEVLDFFGNPAAVLVAAGGRFALYDARRKAFYRGPATPENLARLFPLPLPADDLVDLVCGAAPLVEGAAARVDPGRGYASLRVEGDGVVQELRVDPQGAVTRSVRQVGGGLGAGSYQLTFGGRRLAGGAWFPTVVELRADVAKVRLDLTWGEVQVNAPLDPKLFQLDPPRGAQVIEVDGGA